MRRCLMRLAGKSWVGRSISNKTPPLWCMRSIWRSGHVHHHLVRLFMPTTECNSYHGLQAEDPLGRLAAIFRNLGDALDNAMMQSFWSSMQVELLIRRK